MGGFYTETEIMSKCKLAKINQDLKLKLEKNVLLVKLDNNKDDPLKMEKIFYFYNNHKYILKYNH